MNQVTIRQLVRQGSRGQIEAWLPFEIVSDGEVVAVVRHPSDGMAALGTAMIRVVNADVRHPDDAPPDVRQADYFPIPKEAQLRR